MFGCAQEETTIVVDKIPQEPEPVNTAPIVNAGMDQNIILPDTTTLIGKVTDDNPESDISMSWEKVSGLGTVTFSNPELSTTIVSFSAPGEYVLKLIASDGELSGSDEVKIKVTQVQKSNIAVIDGDFEDKEMHTKHFSDFDNNVGVGYTFARNNIGPIDGTGDIRIRITSAKRDASERPAFKIDLTEPVKTGKNYKVGITMKVLQGKPRLVAASLGGEKTFEKTSEEIKPLITRYEFKINSDTTQDKLYFFFDGTSINRFRLDDITMEEI